MCKSGANAFVLTQILRSDPVASSVLQNSKNLFMPLIALKLITF